MTGNKGQGNEFLLNSLADNSSSGFANRMNAVFGNLSSLEDNHQEWQRRNKSENKRYIKLDPVSEESIKSKPVVEEIFKRPALGRNSLKRPYLSTSTRDQFYRDPSKWKRYTLADVPDQDMSEKSNTNAAMSFLADRKRQKIEASEIDNEMGQSKPVFCKPQKPIVEDILKNPVQAGKGFLIMPEIVVGQKKTKVSSKNVKKETPERSTNTIILDHLEDNDDEQEMETDVTFEPVETVQFCSKRNYRNDIS